MIRGATGLIAWLTQRATAIYIALFSIFAIGLFVVMPPQSYQEWHQMMKQPMVSVSSLLFMVSLMLHAWIGMRDVVIDYIHPFAIRITVLAFMMFALLMFGIWTLQILLTNMV